ncbi:hypothetical protein LZ30DRAFT_394583 [Colletotrichum cereale]|nr:hypothetical protein LZ30DRAFT_394583 [Colletotrichum cereale]
MSLAALAGVVRGASVDAIDGARHSLDILLAGLVIEVFDTPFCWKGAESASGRSNFEDGDTRLAASHLVRGLARAPLRTS